jgi:Fe2+ transport system protein B
VRIIFDVTHHPTRLHVVEALRGHSGHLTLTHLAIDSYEREEYLLFSGVDEAGTSLDQETLEKLFGCSGQLEAVSEIPESVVQRLRAEADLHVRATISRSLEQNNVHFNEARDKLERWADDLVLAAEKALRDTKEQIKALRREARQATTLEEHHQIQEKIQKLERQQRRQRQDIFTAEDEIIAKRDVLIESLEKRLAQRTEATPLFTIAWTVT